MEKEEKNTKKKTSAKSTLKAVAKATSKKVKKVTGIKKTKKNIEKKAVKEEKNNEHKIEKQEEKVVASKSKKVKKSKRKYIILLIIIIIVILLISLLCCFKKKENEEISFILSEKSNLYVNGGVITSYADFKEHFDSSALDEDVFEDNNIAILITSYDECSEKNFEMEDYKQIGNQLNVYFSQKVKCEACPPKYRYYFLPISKKVNKDLEVTMDYQTLNNHKCFENISD